MRKTLALVAHDAKKDDMAYLIKAHRDELADVDLVATRDTGQLIEKRIGLPVTLLQSGPLGGDQQIGALIASEEVDAVIFLRDGLTADIREPDVCPLARLCDIHNVPVATNLVTAEAVLHLMAEHPEALGRHQLATRFAEGIIAQHK
jgi:methylglyoxal synthase